MKNQKAKNYQNQYLLNKNKGHNTFSLLSPAKDKYYINDQNLKDDEYLQANNKKYYENNSYNYMTPLSDFNNKYSSPELNDDYSKNKYINQKYNDLTYNNYEYQKYIEDDYNMKFENENGNEKLHQIKDEYIEYLQRQLDENNKKIIKFETKSNEFQKRYKNLVEDNKLLNETLNERTSKLNEIIQENENLRLQLNNNIENENKIKSYYEKKINLYETNINDCNKIINDLKERNEKMNTSSKNNSDENLNNNNNIINNNNENNNYLNNNESNEEELQLIKNQNAIYLNNIKSKENTIELITKENEKLLNENRIYRTQIEQYTQQITNLYNTIKQKNKIINIFKIKEGIIDNCNDIEFEKKLEGMKVSLSQENIHFMNNTFNNNNNKDLTFDISKDELINSNTFNMGNKKNSDKINQSIDKLINDNEENKMKIEMLNNKIKSLDQIEKKYFEFIKNSNSNTNNYIDKNKNIKQKNENIDRYSEKDIIENKKENDINTYELNIKKEKMKNEEEKNIELDNDIIIDDENNSKIDFKAYKKYIKKDIDKIEEKKESEEVSRDEDIKQISSNSEEKELEDLEKEKREKEEKERREKEEKERIEREEKERREKEEKERREKEEKERIEREEKERREREEKERIEREEKERREREEKERIEREEKERREREEKERIEREEKERREKEEKERIEREEKERREREERERIEREEKERKEREEKERREREEKERIEREEKERREREERERIEREEKERKEREEKERREKEERERIEREEKEEKERKEREEKERKEREENRKNYVRRRRVFGRQREEENRKKEEEEKKEKEKQEEEEKKKEEEKKNEEENNSENSKKNHGMDIKDEKDEIKDTVREMNRKKNYTHVPKNKKRFKISDELDVTEINTSSPVIQQNLSFSLDDKNNNTNARIFLFGIDRNDNFHIFDLRNKKWSKRKILEIEDISDTFQKDYQYEGTILYNTLSGVFILTGQKIDILYYYNSSNETINKICKFNNCHDNGSLMLDKEYNRLFVFGGKNTCSCEYYSFNDKKISILPDLNMDRANASFVICNNRIYGFFGFSYNKNNYSGSIEYIDYKKLDKWYELKDINFLNKEISFDIESVSTLYFKENMDKILIYAGIKGDNEDFITEHYYLYDTKENSIDLIKKWNNKMMKYTRTTWRNYTLSRREPAGFHFAKNSNFLDLPKGIIIDGYDENINILIDYKNNVHFIDQDKKTIDIFKGDM